jgi:sugar/nucleoside kinase (ribokinase family)
MGVVTSLDFSLPDPESESGKANWPSILRETLPYVDIFVPSLEETLQIIMPEKYSEIRASAGTSDIIDLVPLSLVREAGRLIIDYGVKILLIKAGARGAYLITGDVSPVCKKSGINLKAKDWDFREFLCNAYKADESRILNASGAGDAANAAFLSAILDGEPPEMAVKLACIAGRNNLYFHGSYPDNCNWDTMKEEIMTTPDQIVRF